MPPRTRTQEPGRRDGPAGGQAGGGGGGSGGVVEGEEEDGDEAATPPAVQGRGGHIGDGVASAAAAGAEGAGAGAPEGEGEDEGEAGRRQLEHVSVCARVCAVPRVCCGGTAVWARTGHVWRPAGLYTWTDEAKHPAASLFLPGCNAASS